MEGLVRYEVYETPDGAVFRSEPEAQAHVATLGVQTKVEEFAGQFSGRLAQQTRAKRIIMAWEKYKITGMVARDEDPAEGV